jgi:hypothetical protein
VDSRFIVEVSRILLILPESGFVDPALLGTIATTFPKQSGFPRKTG